jgi:hypothetical protein
MLAPRLALALAIAAGALGVASPPPARAEAPAEPAPTSVDALFAHLARSKGLAANFREEKRIALLVAPLTSEGTVHFDRARGLARHTTSPSRRSLLLAGSTLTSWNGKKVETIDLRSQPQLRAVADAFALTLAGDRAGLERLFHLQLTSAGQDAGSGASRLRLAPIAPALRKMVKEIEITFEGLVVTSLRVAEANGDVATTTFTDVDASRSYAAAEAAAIFRVPPGPTR